MNQFGGGKYQPLLRLFEAGATTVNFAPVIAVLFLAARMRAIQLSKGDTEKHALPQPWAQLCMYAATLAVFGQVVMVLLVPVVAGEVHTLDDGHVDLNKSFPGSRRLMAAKIFAVLRFVFLVLLVGG